MLTVRIASKCDIHHPEHARARPATVQSEESGELRRAGECGRDGIAVATAQAPVARGGRGSLPQCRSHNEEAMELAEYAGWTGRDQMLDRICDRLHGHLSAVPLSLSGAGRLKAYGRDDSGVLPPGALGGVDD